MSSPRRSRARALSKALSKHWRRVRDEPRLFPHVIGKAWRVLRGGRLDALVERNQLRTDWFSDYGAWVGTHERIDPLHLVMLAERVRALTRSPHSTRRRSRRSRILWLRRATPEGGALAATTR